MSSSSTRATRQRVLATVMFVAVGLAVVACVPEPAATPTSASGAISPSTPSESPDASPTASAEPIALPADCTQAYSEGMIAALREQGLPLNDPGITLLSTEHAPLLELMDRIPTLRCTWGAPSEVGLSTNISLVDATQSADVLDALAQAGFGCEDSGATTICRIKQRGVTLDDAEYVRGETHGVQDGLWVSTSWINLAPEGYTEDILGAVGG